MFEQLKQNYMASFGVKIENLEQALESQNAQALSSSIHQLAGSSGSYGFDDIADLCDEIESLSQCDDSIDSNTKDKTQQLISLMAAYIKST